MKFYIKPLRIPKGYLNRLNQVLNKTYSMLSNVQTRNFIMRINLLFILGLLSIMHVSANVKAQKISLNISDVSLSELFIELRKQSSYDFFFDEMAIKDIKLSNIHVKNATLKETLNKTFKNLPLEYSINDKIVVVTKASQKVETMAVLQKTIRGKVVDEAGEPLAGATILGAQLSTMTNTDGDFTLKAEEGATLIVSYLGYQTKEVKIGQHDRYTIMLVKDDQDLTAVVVTALGLRKEEASLGYSVEEIKGEVFEKVKSDKLTDMLAGQSAGLRVNSRSGVLQDAAITLRGRAPLYVVNGNPVNVGFRGIAADDIESVSILKGPQASVLYGSRGIDGAIVITTKSSGKSKDLEISVNSSTMTSAGYIAIPEVQNIYGQGEFGQYAFKDGKGGGLYDDIWIWGPKMDQLDPSTPSGYWETPQYNSPIDSVTGERIPTAFRSYANNLQNLLRNGFTTNNNISVSQQIEAGGYNIGVNQMNRRGMIPNTGVNQLGLNVGGNYTIKDRLKFDVNINYSNLFTDNYPPVGYSNDQVYYNTVLYMGGNNDIMDLRDYWNPGREGYEQRNYNYAWFQNPWFLAYEYLRPYAKKRIISSLSLDYDLGKNTHFILKGGNDYQYTINEFKKPYAWVNGESGSYEKTTYDETLLDVNAIITTNQSFGDFDIDFMAGANWNELDRNTLNGATSGGLIVPGIYDFSNSKKQSTVFGRITNKRMYGVYGSATLAWKSAIYLGFTGRNDWSSALIKGNRSYFYPSVSLSTVVSNLVNLPDPVSFLKFRGSWVKVGRDMDAYNLSSGYYLSQVWGSEPAFAPDARLIDPDIQPSMTDSYELGMDLRLFKNRLRFDFSYFNTLDKQWIQEVNTPVTTGHAKMLTNGNAYLRDGFEVILSGKPIISNDFNWDISANVSNFKTVLYDIYNNLPNYGNFKIGDRSDAFFSSVYLREPGTNNFVVKDNGLPEVDKFSRNIGNKDSKWEAGITNTINYKKFRFSFNVSGRYGGLIYSELNARMLETGSDPRTAIPAREEDWNRQPSYIPENAVMVTGGSISYSPTGEVLSDTRTFAPSTIPVMFKDWMRQMGNLNSRKTIGWNVYDASFIKLRTASLTYDLSDQIENLKFIKRANVSLIGNNLLMWKRLPHEDPDGDVTTLGYPTERYIGLNFSITF